MSNEMYNTIARVTDGIYEGIYTCWLFCLSLSFSLMSTIINNWDKI